MTSSELLESAELGQPAPEDSEGPVTFQINAMNDAVRSIWTDKSRKAVSTMVLIIVIGFYNLSFSLYTFRSAWKGDDYDGNATNRALTRCIHVVAGLEVIALAHYSVSSIIHVIGHLLQYPEHRGPQTLQFVRSLEMVGNFSFFMFVPGPKKVMYWYNNRHVIMEMYGKNRPVLRMVQETSRTLYFSPFNAEARTQLWENLPPLPLFNCCQDSAACRCLRWCGKVVIVGIVNAAWFGEVLVKPLLILVFVFVSLPAVILKLANLPSLHPILNKLVQYESVSMTAVLHVLFPYIGIIMQASRTWAIREIEHSAVCRFETIIHHEDGETSKNLNARVRLYNMVVDAIAKHLSRRQSMCLLTVLDNAMVASILRVHFGDAAPMRTTPPDYPTRIASLALLN